MMLALWIPANADSTNLCIMLRSASTVSSIETKGNNVSEKCLVDSGIQDAAGVDKDGNRSGTYFVPTRIKKSSSRQQKRSF